MKRFLVGFSLVATTAYALPARAYNNREHERLPDQAIQIANILRRGSYLTNEVSQLTGTSVPPLTTRPSQIPASEEARWQTFLTEARAMPGRLGQIRTGLADPLVPSSSCGNVYPKLTTGHLNKCKAMELPFAVKRHWASDTSDCFIRGNYFPGDPDKAEFFNSLPTDKTGALLGFWSQNVDDEIGDSIWYLSFTNAGALGTANVILADASDFALTIFLAPFACLFALFSGDNCGDDAENWAHQANPVTRADEFINDIEKSFSPHMDGDDLFSTTGVWHFINVESPDEGDFNKVAGMHYTHGGWRGGVDLAGIGRIDLLDWLVIIGGDASMLTLDPDQAQGVSRYQQSPDGHLSRVKDDWFHTIGHIEFEPLDNLALYGWRRFQSGHDASGLGWVLHALGDAVEPQHGIAATGWGHRPFEDFVGFFWGDMFHEGQPQHYQLMPDILASAYTWWKFIDDAQKAGNPNDIPIRDMITELARATRSVSDYALQSGISVPYGSGGDKKAAQGYYAGTEVPDEQLLANGTGATIAFLVKTAKIAAASPDTSPDPCACGPGEALTRQTGGSICVSCAMQNQVEVDGQCEPNCPEDEPIVQSTGHCSTVCDVQPCNGVACPPQKFVQGSSCVDQCSGDTPVAVGRNCAATCPDDTVEVKAPSGAVFCERSFCNTSAANSMTDPNKDTVQICCPSSKPFISTDNGAGVCVESCPVDQFFFVPLEGQPSLCATGCTAPQQYFVPGETAHACLSGCPTDSPFATPTEAGQQCGTSCASSSFPFFDVPSPLTGGTTNQCVAACTTTLPRGGGVVPAFHLDSGQCVATCPTATPFHLTDGLCVAICPTGTPNLGACPPSSPPPG